MKIKHQSVATVAVMIVVLTAASTYLRADTGTCGGASTTLPFTDVPSSNIFFCSIAEAYFSALTNGMTATTYNPSGNVPREQMAAFVTRTLDQSLKRGSQRAALDQFWTGTFLLNLPAVGPKPRLVKSDGTDLWVASFENNFVTRTRASDGKLLDIWGDATNAFGVLPAMGLVFVTGRLNPGKLYRIIPSAPAGSVTTVSSALGANPQAIAFDGKKIWTANTGGSVSILTPSSTIPWLVTTVSSGFTTPVGIIYDGKNIWVTDSGAGTLLKLDSVGAIQETVTVGSNPAYPCFDGANIWVPNSGSNTVSVVRASTATVLATLNMDGQLSGPTQAAFDGERILVTNSGDLVSVWKATDLTPIGNFTMPTGSTPFGVCSDGINFWITLANNFLLVRF